MLSMLAIAKLPVWLSPVMGLWVVALWALYRRSVRPARPDVFFGVTVAAEWPDSPAGRAVAAAYRRRLDVVTAVALALAVAGAWPPALARTGALLPLVGLFAQAGVAFGAYLAGRRATVPAAVPSSPVREASLEPERSMATGRRWLAAQAGPAALLATSAALLAWRYPAIPAVIPAHADLAGHVDGWAAKSVGSVFAVPMVAVVMLALLAALGWATVHSGRRLRGAGRDDRYLRAVLWLLLAAEYFAAVVLSAVGWMPGLSGTRWAALPTAVAIAASPAFAVGLAYFALRVWPTLRLGATVAAGDGTPDACWTWGLIYSNRADPALLVPKRFGFGYTVNFGRPAAWALLAGVLAAMAVIAAVPVLLVGHG